MKRRIFPYDFTPYYPVGILPCPMYVDVANRIYERIKDMELNLPNSDKLKKDIAINVAIYFEDKMSDIGLWNTFVSKHMLMYSHSLPFFDDFDALDKDDVNAKEVELLVWIVLSRNFDDRFLNPLTMGEEAANLIMEILTEEDEVEVNDGLYDYIYNVDKANDYFMLKHVLIWLRRSYLLCSPLSEERFEELKDSYSMQFNKSESIYYAETSFIMKSEIGPLAVEPHLWLADMYAENEMYIEADKLRDMKYCQQDIFEVIEADPKYAVLKDSKEEVYRLKNVYPDVFWKGAYICTALVKYADNDWEINGVVFNSHREVYERMCEHKKQLVLSYERAYPLYMERTGGKRLAFFEKQKQLKDWLGIVTPELDMTEVCHRLPSGSVVAFISQKAGIVFVPGVIHAIKSKDNPYYGKCDARSMQSETMNAVINLEAMHPESLHYLLENEMLQDGDISYSFPSDLGKAIFTRNIDFIARNHRRHHYHDHDY